MQNFICLNIFSHCFCCYVAIFCAGQTGTQPCLATWGRHLDELVTLPDAQRGRWISKLEPTGQKCPPTFLYKLWTRTGFMFSNALKKSKEKITFHDMKKIIENPDFTVHKDHHCFCSASWFLMTYKAYHIYSLILCRENISTLGLENHFPLKIVQGKTLSILASLSLHLNWGSKKRGATHPNPHIS